MNEKTHLVLAGWLELTDEERREFLGAMFEYLTGSGSARRVIEETAQALKNRRAHGSLEVVCPCCGR